MLFFAYTKQQKFLLLCFEQFCMMMKNYNQSVEINHNPNWPYVLDHHFRILITGGSRSGTQMNS